MIVTEIDSLYFKIFVICFTLFHTTSMTLSRFYMGAHSLADVIAGYSLGLLGLSLFIRYGDAYWNWVVERDFTYTSTVLILTSLALLYCYPFPEKYTTAFGDSAASICVLLGTSMASNVLAHNNLLTYFSKSSSHLEHGFLWMFGIVTARLIVGYVLIFATRLIFKTLTLTIVERMVESTNKESYAKEIPTKFVVYTMIGWNCVYTIPLCFSKLGIN
jgi:sphingosine-1-phosphate phosphatase 1